MYCKETTLQLDSLELHYRKCLSTSVPFGAPEDQIRLRYENVQRTVNSVQRLVKLLSRLRVGSATMERLFEELHRRDLCVRCGLCCTSGAPPITLDDARTLSDIDVVLEKISEVTGQRVEKGDHTRLFVLWNAALQLLRPCPFLTYDDNLAKCRIYEARPSFCRIFKCWSPKTDQLRHQHLNEVMRQLQEVGLSSDLEPYRDVALRTISSILAVVESLV